MELKKYYVNFNYESQIFEGLARTHDSSVIYREMEFIYFYLERSSTILSTTNNYHDKDLELWAKRGCVIPRLQDFDPQANAWWGSLENRPLEKVLNSKKTSYQILENLRLLPEGSQLLSRDKLPDNFEGKILKGLHGYSGASNYLPPFALDKILGEEFIVEPFFAVRLNLGHFVRDNKVHHYLIFNRPSGSFIGGIFLARSLLQDLLTQFNQSLEEIEEKVRLTFKEYQKLGPIDYLQVDSFIYEEDDHFKLYIGHDIQHRKTMGSFLLCLADYFPSQNFMWLNYPKGQFKIAGSVELGHTQKKWSSIYLALNPKNLEHLSIVNGLNSSYNKVCNELANLIKHHED